VANPVSRRFSSDTQATAASSGAGAHMRQRFGTDALEVPRDPARVDTHLRGPP